MLHKIPNYIKYIYTNFLLLIIFNIVFRILFYSFFAELDTATSSEIKKAFWLGIRFDIKLASIAVFPLAFLILIVNRRFFKYQFYKKLATIYIVLTYVILTLFYVIDFGYYKYLSIRLDAASLRFLEDLKISSQVLIESYPVYKGVFGLLVLAFLVFKMAKYLYLKFKENQFVISKKLKTFYFITTFLVLSFSIYNSFNHYPLRWSEAFFSKNNVINQFTLNPVLSFFDSFKFRSEGVNMVEFKKSYPVIAKHLNLPKDKVLFERKAVFDSAFSKKPNIVIVMLESLGTKPIGYYGNPTKSTPVIDSLIEKSISFPNFYIHKYGTAASIFGSITGLPDIDDVKTASRNPMIIDQRVLFDQFKGYEKLYFLGGSANWANIRGVFQANIEGLKIFEEGSYENENRADVWGIDDYELFKESNKELKKLHQKNKPFVAFIQTSSNHTPFTVPDQKESYRPLQKDEINADILKKGGFRSIEPLNSLRYLDFNVGRFLERTKEAGYYNNTIFVFFGDHNTAMSRTDILPKEYDLNIETLHVPFLIHGPKFVEPAVMKKNGKLIDIFPTVINLAKINHTNYTLGNNLLDSIKYKNPSSFIYIKINGEPAVGLIQDSLYYSKTTITNAKALYNLRTRDLDDLKEKYPNKVSAMDSLLDAYYHSTKYLYFNNKKSDK